MAPRYARLLQPLGNNGRRLEPQGAWQGMGAALTGALPENEIARLIDDLGARLMIRTCGEMPEWSNGAVSKTVVLSRVPRVRIPVSPPPTPSTCLWFQACSQLADFRRIFTAQSVSSASIDRFLQPFQGPFQRAVSSLANIGSVWAVFPV